eukprot:gene22405-29517_t
MGKSVTGIVIIVRQPQHDAQEMGLVNTVVPLAQLEEETVAWCREILKNSPTAIRILKAAMNAAEDGQAGIQCLLSSSNFQSSKLAHQ